MLRKVKEEKSFTFCIFMIINDLGMFVFCILKDENHAFFYESLLKNNNFDEIKHSYYEQIYSFCSSAAYGNRLP